MEQVPASAVPGTRLGRYTLLGKLATGGMAEVFLAAWLEERGLEPGEVTVASKWGYTYTADWTVHAAVHEVKDLSADSLRRQLAESREILGPP